jgi:predicted nucleic-acid-binding Zn-ribbon protein
MENITELGKLWQEEMINLSDIPPENLDAFENRIQDILHRLGKAMMEWKLKDWNSSINKDKSKDKSKDKCPKCDSKVHNRKRTKQILTTVATIDYERYMIYCPKCKHTEYPLDCALGIQPLQRMSSSVEELAILCGASWDYGKSEYILSKLLRHDKLSHETIQEKTNAVGSCIPKELEGSKIKELESNKRLQGDYFESMKLWSPPKLRIYVDMDGVMINSRDNAKRMEGKVGLVWSERELVKENTYSLTDKLYIGTFTDLERFKWDMVAEIYKRSGGNLDGVDVLVRGDGASWINGFRIEHLPKSRYILDHHHLCEKVKERIGSVIEKVKDRCKSVDELMRILNAGDVDGALSYIDGLSKRYRKKDKLETLKRLSGYIERNREGIWYAEAKSQGISIGSGSADKAGDIVICRRMKLRGMRWSRHGSDAVENIRIMVLNGEWDQFWSKYKVA